MVTNVHSETNWHSPALDITQDDRAESPGGEKQSGGPPHIPLRRLMVPFATAIYAKAAVLREYMNALSPAQQRRFLESISEDIKKATNLHPHDVSEAAAEEARNLGIDDLAAKTWHDQPKFDSKRKASPRRTSPFLVEHMVPVSALVRACRQQPNVEGVLDVLTNRLRVVWLLRREDKVLTSLGFHHDRPNPEEAYRLAGITLISRTKAQDDEGGGR